MICNNCLKKFTSKYYFNKHNEKCNIKYEINKDIINNNDKLINYNIKENIINFNTEHINYDFIHKLVTINEIDAFQYFIKKLFDNNNNKIIRKYNLKDKYTQIYIGYDIWINILNKYIYNILISILSDTMIIYINNYSNNYNIKQIQNLLDFLDILKNNGKSNHFLFLYKNIYKDIKLFLKHLFHSFI